MALDYPERVIRLAVLDIVPTWEAFSRADMAFGLGYRHCDSSCSALRPAGAPCRYRSDLLFLSRRDRTEVFAPEAMGEYLRCFRVPRTVHAICEDYRAATLDFAHDEGNRREGGA